MLACLPLIAFAIILLPLLTLLLLFNIVTISFQRLGLSPEAAVLLLWASVIGSMINIPISRRKVLVESAPIRFLPFVFYYPPRVAEQVIAINVGGAIIPILFSLYLLQRAPLGPTLIGTIIVAIVSKLIARPVPGMGITMPAFIPPLVSVSVALIAVTLALSSRDAAPAMAYISGAIGTLVGADLLNWRAIRELGATMLSIGGAGVFDGIFLVGVVAALLA